MFGPLGKSILGRNLLGHLPRGVADLRETTIKLFERLASQFYPVHFTLSNFVCFKGRVARFSRNATFLPPRPVDEFSSKGKWVIRYSKGNCPSSEAAKGDLVKLASHVISLLSLCYLGRFLLRRIEDIPAFHLPYWVMKLITRHFWLVCCYGLVFSSFIIRMFLFFTSYFLLLGRLLHPQASREGQTIILGCQYRKCVVEKGRESLKMSRSTMPNWSIV